MLVVRCEVLKARRNGPGTPFQARNWHDRVSATGTTARVLSFLFVAEPAHYRSRLVRTYTHSGPRSKPQCRPGVVSLYQ